MSDRHAGTTDVPLPASTPVRAGEHHTGEPSPRWLPLRRIVGSRAVRFAFVAVALGLCCYGLADEWSRVRPALGHLGFPAVAGAMLSVLAGLAATMQLYRVMLAALGSPLPVRPAARVLFIGQLGKYLPGSLWPILAQMELGTAHKVPRHRSASASVLTMLIQLLAGLLLALITLPFVPATAAYRWAFLAVPVLLVMLYPRVLNRVLNLLLRLARRPPLEQPLRARSVAAALGWGTASWVCYGLQIWLLATRLGAPDGRTALIAVGGFAFVWSVGFVIVFLPAGAGVRDVLLVAILGSVLGVGAATAVALASRILMTAGDLISAGGAAGLGWRSRPRERKAQP